MTCKGHDFSWHAANDVSVTWHSLTRRVPDNSHSNLGVAYVMKYRPPVHFRKLVLSHSVCCFSCCCLYTCLFHCFLLFVYFTYRRMLSQPFFVSKRSLVAVMVPCHLWVRIISVDGEAKWYYCVWTVSENIFLDKDSQSAFRCRWVCRRPFWWQCRVFKHKRFIRVFLWSGIWRKWSNVHRYDENVFVL